MQLAELKEATKIRDRVTLVAWVCNCHCGWFRFEMCMSALVRHRTHTMISLFRQVLEGVSVYPSQLAGSLEASVHEDNISLQHSEIQVNKIKIDQ